MMKRLCWIAPVLWATTAFGLTVDVSLYKSGGTEKTATVAPGGTVNVDVVLTVFGSSEFLTAYEMDIIDGTAFGTASQGISIQSITNRTIARTGWADASLSTYPVALWSTALDAAAYSSNAAYDLPGSVGGTSYVLETLTLTAPATFPAGGYTITLRPQDTGLLFTGKGGAPGAVGDTTGASFTIVPEPMTGLLLAAIAAIGLVRRR